MPENRKRGERHSLPTKPKTRSPCRRGDDSTTNTKGRVHHPGLLGCRLLVLGCHRILQKKRKLNNTEQQRNPKRLSTRVPPPKLSQSTPGQSKAQPETPKGRAGTQVGREKRNGSAKNLAPKSARAKERPPTLTLAHYGQKQSPAKQHLRPAPKTLDGRGNIEQRKTLILRGAIKKGQSTCPKQSKA